MKMMLGVAVVTVALASASFQAQTGGAASTNMDILRQKVKADKKLVIATNMALTDAEAKGFWPVYDAYQTDLAAINARTTKLIAAYADVYNKGAGVIPNETAKSLLTEMLAIDEAEVKLRQGLAAKLEPVLPMTKVARYLQIENKIRAVIKYELAAAIPLVQ